jgi:hypothetical protein
VKKITSLLILLGLISCSRDNSVIDAPTEAPTSLNFTGDVSDHFLDKLTIRVAGISKNNFIKIYEGQNGCETLITSATSQSTHIDIEVTPAAGRSYKFYATATNGSGIESPCTTSFLTYTKANCPNGFIAFGDNKFCVMKYEARNESSKPASIATGTPWVEIEAQDALNACQSLGPHYDLMTNGEWMEIARDIEGVDANWSGASVSNGILSSGHTGSLCDSTLENVGADCSTVSADFSTSRIHTLSNGEKIWDFAGNASEWINWEKSTLSILEKGPNNCDAGWMEIDSRLNEGNCDLTADHIAPSTALTNASHNIGLVHVDDSKTFSGVSARGGDYANSANAGIYSLDTTYELSDKPNSVSFRCVYRP